jgi:16S rRNA (adenine1518-N6/adenine1519-N6)-dimethyltransferase
MQEPDDLPPLREVIAELGLSAKKSFGQNFLLDFNLTRRIARASGALENHTVIEIGPGPGGLTRALFMEGAKQVIVVESDPRFLPVLTSISDYYPDRLTILMGDALKTPLENHISGPCVVIANLPYNVATALLINWLKTEPWPPWFERLTLMFQKEVASRIVAKPGQKAYGRLSVLSNFRCHTQTLFDINPRAFTPPPKVTSTLVELTPKTMPPDAPDISALETVTRAAFSQRRKMLRSSLKSLFAQPLEVLKHAKIEPDWRAEQVDLAGYCRLAHQLARS